MKMQWVMYNFLNFLYKLMKKKKKCRKKYICPALNNFSNYEKKLQLTVIITACLKKKKSGEGREYAGPQEVVEKQEHEWKVQDVFAPPLVCWGWVMCMKALKRLSMPLLFLALITAIPF